MAKSLPSEVRLACQQLEIDPSSLKQYWVDEVDVFLLTQAGLVRVEISALPAAGLEWGEPEPEPEPVAATVEEPKPRTVGKRSTGKKSTSKGSTPKGQASKRSTPKGQASKGSTPKGQARAGR